MRPVRSNQPANEWNVPLLLYRRNHVPGKVEAVTLGIMNSIAMAGDGKQTLAIIPDTDQSWIGVEGMYLTAGFPLRGETNPGALLLAVAGDWREAYRRAIVEVFDFNEPRQFSPVSEAVEQICRFYGTPVCGATSTTCCAVFPTWISSIFSTLCLTPFPPRPIGMR